MKEKLVILIILLIGFQQFPVIRIGGSFKIYELLAMVLLLTDLLFIKKLKFQGYLGVLVGFFFIVSPFLSDIVAYLFLPYPKGFYRYYPDVESLNLNYWIYPSFQLIFMFFNFSVFNYLLKSSFIYVNFKVFSKIFVAIGTCIAIYSLIAMFTFDVITLLPSFLQNKGTYYSFRSLGMSQEPGQYVLYQMWICLFLFHTKEDYSKIGWFILAFINVWSLLFTFSTVLLAMVGLLIAGVFIFNYPLSTKIKAAVTFVAIGLVGYLVLSKFNLVDTFTRYAFDKIENFLSAPDHTMDSGSFRSYTTRIGIEIFKEYPLFGVGVGNSVYYMYIYEFKMGVVSFGERLHAGSFPQGLVASVFSEQGLVGGILLLLILFYCFAKLWKYRNHNQYFRMFFLGYVFNFVIMLTIAPTYTLYLWVFIALAMSYVRNYENDAKQKKGVQV